MRHDLFDWPEEASLFFDAARLVETWTMRFDCGTLRHWLLFVRRASILNELGTHEDGVQVAMFAATEDGVVTDWSEFYVVESHSIKSAFSKFRYLYLNRMIGSVRMRPPGPSEEESARLDSMFSDGI